MIRAAALLLAALMAGGGAAAEVCLLPLENGAPVNEVERGQPYRIIYGSGTIPGFPHVLIAPLNRDRPDRQLYTVRGMRFEPLGAEFPRGALWVSPVTPPRADGSIYGWELLGRSLYRLAPEAEEFEPVAAAEGAARFAHDAGEGRLYVQTGDGALAELDGDRLAPSPLAGLNAAAPGYSRTATLPRFVPPLGVHLAAEEDDSLWARGTEGVWREVDLGGPVHQAWRVGTGAWHHDPAEGIVTVLVGGTALVFDARAPGEARFLYRLPAGSTAISPEAPMMAWERAPDAPPAPGFLGRLLGAEAVPRAPLRLVQILREGPAPPPGEGVSGAFYRSASGRLAEIPDVGLIELPEFGAVLVRHAAGVSVYRAGRLAPAPRLAPDRVGKYLRAVRFGERVFLQSEAGLYEIGPGLVPVPRPWPGGGPRPWEVVPSVAFGGALVRNVTEGRLWITADGRQFQEVRNLTGAPLRALGSDLPGRRAALAATGDGAALVADCP